jgi:hypothetical protein
VNVRVDGCREYVRSILMATARWVKGEDVGVKFQRDKGRGNERSQSQANSQSKQTRGKLQTEGEGEGESKVSKAVGRSVLVVLGGGRMK